MREGPSGTLPFLPGSVLRSMAAERLFQGAMRVSAGVLTTRFTLFLPAETLGGSESVAFEGQDNNFKKNID